MKIMVGYKKYNSEGRVEETVLRHARAFDATIYLVTSMEVGESIPREVFSRAEAVLDKGKSFFAKRGIACESHLLETGLTTGENLLEFARKHQIDEIIIGVKNRSKLGKLIFGSTAQHVILNSSCPVLCVNEK